MTIDNLLSWLRDYGCQATARDPGEINKAYNDGHTSAVNWIIKHIEKNRAAIEAGIEDQIHDRKVAEWMQDELSDYSDLIERASEVYCHATGGKISNVLTIVSNVKAVIDDYINELIDEAIKDEKEEAGMRPPLRFKVRQCPLTDDDYEWVAELLTLDNQIAHTRVGQPFRHVYSDGKTKEEVMRISTEFAQSLGLTAEFIGDDDE